MIEVEVKEDDNKYIEEGKKALSALGDAAKHAAIFGLGVGVVAGKKVVKVGKNAAKAGLSTVGKALVNASESLDDEDTTEKTPFDDESNEEPFNDDYDESEFFGDHVFNDKESDDE